MSRTIGFIGGGNMGSAIMGGVIAANLVGPTDIIAADLFQTALKALEDKFGIRTTTSNTEVASQADILFLSVKPNIYPIVINEIKDCIKESTIVVSIAAGQSIDAIQGLFGKDVKIARVMPNTPALVGEGMAGVSTSKSMTAEDAEQVMEIFRSIGKAEPVGEYLMDVVTGISGSSPAYVYLFIEAMADAAVAEGMPRAQAYVFAAQAVYGSAKMVMETGQHPGALKDMVCSPGGTTIAAVCELENMGMRSAVISAVRTCTEKSREMSKN